jgi:hypothetical protein
MMNILSVRTKISQSYLMIYLTFFLLISRSNAHKYLRNRSDRELQTFNDGILEYPFRLIWRIEVTRTQDREPTLPELNGVASATSSWLKDTLSTVTIPNSLTLNGVTCAVASSSWLPSTTRPHTVRLDCNISFRTPSTTTRPADIDVRGLIVNNIPSPVIATFTSDYLRKSGSSSSVYRNSRSPVTYLLQIQDFGKVVVPVPMMRSFP